MGYGASGLGRDYDTGDLLAAITANWSGSGTTNLFPLLYEGIGSGVIPPDGFLVPAPYNFHLGLDYLNVTNGTAAAATVNVQVYEFGTASAPFGTPGPVVLTLSLTAGTTLILDQTRFRLTTSPGFFFVVFTVDGTYSSDEITVNARARFTPG